jgi:hypothetical protein
VIAPRDPCVTEPRDRLAARTDFLRTRALDSCARMHRNSTMNTVRLHSGGRLGVAALLLAALTACSGQQKAAATATAAPSPSAADAAIPPTASPYDTLPESVRLVKDRPCTGDFDAMVKRRAIRVGVTFNRTHYFIDKGQERGLTYESLKLFENDRNAA